MSKIVLVRRALWIAVLGAIGGAAYSWLRGRAGGETRALAPWPPLRTAGPNGASPATPDAATPDAHPGGSNGPAWVSPNDDGSCPVGHPIKANDNSGIFHVPGGQFYARTRPERCYTSAEAAIADGYRQAKA